MKMTDLIVDGLATHRITRLVVEDKITEDFREAVFRRHHPSEHKLSYFLTCAHCVSVWAAAGVTVMRLVSETSDPRGSRVFRGTVAVLRYTLAVSGAVSLGHEVAGKLPTPL
jgi:hypothetical protein